MTEKGGAVAARTVLQQCLQARLQVKPADEQSEAQFVQVRKENWIHTGISIVTVKSIWL